MQQEFRAGNFSLGIVLLSDPILPEAPSGRRSRSSHFGLDATFAVAYLRLVVTAPGKMAAARPLPTATATMAANHLRGFEKQLEEGAWRLAWRLAWRRCCIAQVRHRLLAADRKEDDTGEPQRIHREKQSLDTTTVPTQFQRKWQLSTTI